MLIVLSTLSCYAFDQTDAGEYLIISNADGQPLDRGFLVFMYKGEWVFQEQVDNGQFVDRKCTGKCKFFDSSEASIRKMFLNGEMSKLKNVSCIENNAFALCSFTWIDSGKKGYVMVGFSSSGPVPMALKHVRRVIISNDPEVQPDPKSSRKRAIPSGPVP